jgi:lauroyl/myristoyl acyltransferase
LFHFDEILATIGTDHPRGLSGRENMVRALEEGRGGLFFTGHIGNWELMAATVTHSGLPATRSSAVSMMTVWTACSTTIAANTSTSR